MKEFSKNTWIEKLENNLLKKAHLIAFALIAVGAFVFVYLIIALLFNHYWSWGQNLSISETGEFGDFVGGFIGTIISGAGFLFLYLTLKDQREGSNDQRKSFEKERFESKFFELVKFHRDNIQELEYAVHEKDDIDDENEKVEKVIYEKRKVFRAVFEQCIQCRNEIKQYFKHINDAEIYNPEYLKFIKSMIGANELNVSLRLLASIDISYCITFYGLSSEGYIILENIFKDKYNPTFIKQILNYLKLKPTINNTSTWILWRSISKRASLEKKNLIVDFIYSYRKDKRAFISKEGFSWVNDNSDLELYKTYGNNYKKFYGGHQFRLGHYYRHLYQLVKYVDRNPELSRKEKYSYVKILRAQLSNYEQALLFLNSLSSLGLIWELNPDFKRSDDITLNAQNREKRKLITKYNLIRNLPTDEMFGIRLKIFYPNVRFELDKNKL